jgi:hypothetical protein
MKKKKNALWMGFLDAGEKGSPVVRDPKLNTGNPATIYLFNLMRGRILEYRKEVVEPKLRELSPEESSMVTPLQDAFSEARKDFTPRGGQRSMSSPTRRRNRRQDPEIPEPPEIGDDEAWPPLDVDPLDPHPSELSD